MSLLSKENQYKLVTAGAALLAGVIVKAVVTSIWRGVKQSDPPQNPEDLDVHWKDAIVWTIASSAAMGVAGLLARRGAAALVAKPFLADEPII